VLETNAFTAALVQVASGFAATIAPEILAESLVVARGVVRLPLTHPVVEKPVGLVVPDIDPVPPTVRVLLETAGEAAEPGEGAR
jgi:DNA-binding transcriptional LysR family regulator